MSKLFDTLFLNVPKILICTNAQIQSHNATKVLDSYISWHWIQSRLEQCFDWCKLRSLHKKQPTSSHSSSKFFWCNKGTLWSQVMWTQVVCFCVSVHHVTPCNITWTIDIREKFLHQTSSGPVIFLCVCSCPWAPSLDSSANPSCTPSFVPSLSNVESLGWFETVIAASFSCGAMCCIRGVDLKYIPYKMSCPPPSNMPSPLGTCSEEFAISNWHPNFSSRGFPHST